MFVSLYKVDYKMFSCASYKNLYVVNYCILITNQGNVIRQGHLALIPGGKNINKSIHIFVPIS